MESEIEINFQSEIEIRKLFQEIYWKLKYFPNEKKYDDYLDENLNNME